MINSLSVVTALSTEDVTPKWPATKKQFDTPAGDDTNEQVNRRTTWGHLT